MGSFCAKSWTACEGWLAICGRAAIKPLAKVTANPVERLSRVSATPQQSRGYDGMDGKHVPIRKPWMTRKMKYLCGRGNVEGATRSETGRPKRAENPRKRRETGLPS